jgi:hypothetical protein
MTPIGFLGELFDLWRGSIEIVFKLVKTGFHTGALSFTYIPGPTPTTVTFADTAYPYRVIVDIQSGDEVCLRLPYLSPSDYLERGVSMGRFYIHVVNALQAPATVSATIDIMMFVRGGPDLEYQFPVSPRYAPILPQGYGITDTGGPAACDTLTANAPQYDVLKSQVSIGEHVTSLLQLVKAEWPVAIDTTVTNGVQNFSMLAQRFWCPQAKSPTGLTDPRLQGDYLSLIASLYALHRGGLRYRVANTTGSNNPVRAMVTGKFHGQPVFDWGAGALRSMIRGDFIAFSAGVAVRIYQAEGGKNGLSVQVPFYHKYRYAPVRLLSGTSTDNSWFNPGLVLTVAGCGGVNTTASNNLSAILMRGAADDFQLSYFVGVPQLTLYYGSSVP